MSRDIDRQIAELLGYSVIGSYIDYFVVNHDEDDMEVYSPVPQYSSDWNVMPLLVEWLRNNGVDVLLSITSDGGNFAHLKPDQYGEMDLCIGNGESAPLALCRAALSLPPEVLA